MLHAQFHCGNPPPAAEPRIFTRMRYLEFCAGVGADFAVEADFFEARSGPFHDA